MGGPKRASKASSGVAPLVGEYTSKVNCQSSRWISRALVPAKSRQSSPFGVSTHLRPQRSTRFDTGLLYPGWGWLGQKNAGDGGLTVLFLRWIGRLWWVSLEVLVYWGGGLVYRVGMATEPTMTIFSDGTQEWYLNGKLHREDGPACIWPDGYQEWWLNGQLHREDGPARIGTDGTQVWYRNGQRHREDGPAYIQPDEYQEWWRNGIRVPAPSIDPTPGRKEG